MRTWIKPAIALSLLFLAALPANGQIDTSRVYELDPVVVTGTRVEVTRSNVPMTVASVSEQEIRQSGESNLLPVLSGRIPGLFVTERGMTGFGVAEGAAGQITVRGIGSSPNTNVLVLIDGHPQFMGLMGHPLPDSYVASDAERVEVVRGPASILYGTNAMGGVINIITRRQETEGGSASGSASFGSYNTQKYSGSGGYRVNGFDFFGSINHDRTDGHRDASDFNITNGYLKAGYDLTNELRLLVDGGLTKFKSYDPGPVSQPYADASHWVDILRGRGAVTLQNNFGHAEGGFKFFYNFGEHTIYDGFNSNDANGGLMFYQGIRFFPGNVVTIGLDYKRYGGKARNDVNNLDFGEHWIDEIGGYAFVQQFLANRVILNGGLRIENHSLFGSIAVPQAGFAYHLTESVTLKGSASRGFRSPTIRELYLFPAPNPDLEPERMWNFEAGILTSTPRYSSELTGFISDGDNLIQITGQFPNLVYRNTGSFTHKGFEWLGTYFVDRNLRLGASYSYLHTERPITSAPVHQLFLEASYAIGRFTLSSNLHHVAGLITNVQASSRETYTLVGAGLLFRPNPFVEVFVRGDNLLNQMYQINFGYPMPGATVHTGIHFRY